jgi:atypical dual specificity phosphatase
MWYRSDSNPTMSNAPRPRLTDAALSVFNEAVHTAAKNSTEEVQRGPGGDFPRNFHWIVDGKLCGCAVPHRRENIVALYRAGVRGIVSLTENALAPGGYIGTFHLPMDLFPGACPISILHLPTPDGDAPDQTQIRHAMAFIDNVSGAVAVHCLAGEGRTAVILACYLVLKGSHPRIAVEQLREVSPFYFHSIAQRDAVTEYAKSHCEQ